MLVNRRPNISFECWCQSLEIIFRESAG